MDYVDFWPKNLTNFDISKRNSITEVTLKLHSYSRATVFDTLRASHDRHEANWFASTNQI